MGQFARSFEPFYRETSQYISAFCRALNFTPTWQQQLVLDAVQAAVDGTGQRRIAVKSGQGPGKTTCSTVVGLWRGWRRAGALTVVTAPTMRQCRDVWLTEARLRLENAHPLIKKFINVTKSKVEIGEQDGWGVKTVTATKEENAQGYHQANMTVIAEEASGIPREIITQFKGTLSNDDSLFLMIGNPNTRDCSFFDCFNSQREMWHTITLNAEESPIVSKENIAQLAEEFGRESDVFRIRVLGEFPFADPNCVISSEQVEKCTGNIIQMYKHILTPRGLEFGAGRAKQFGIDFARFGGDESTIYRRSGNSIVEHKHFAHTDPNDVLDLAFKQQVEAGWKDSDTVYIADAGGMGQGLMKRFYRAGKQVVEFHNAGKALDQQYDNRITEAWFQAARKIKMMNCYVPKDNQLIQQLCGRQYFTTRKGKLILESKDEYMKRGNNSPDRADGFVMSMYDGAIATGQMANKGQGTLVGASTK